MDQKQLFKQMIDFNKATFEKSFSAMNALQEQTEKMGANLIEQASWLPEEGRKAAGQWVSACKKGRDSFKKSVDSTFQKVEKFY